MVLGFSSKKIGLILLLMLASFSVQCTYSVVDSMCLSTWRHFQYLVTFILHHDFQLNVHHLLPGLNMTIAKPALLVLRKSLVSRLLPISSSFVLVRTSSHSNSKTRDYRIHSSSIEVCMRPLVTAQDQYFLGIWDMLITRLVCFSLLLCFFQQIHYLFQYLLVESLSQSQVQTDFVGFCWRTLCGLP